MTIIIEDKLNQDIPNAVARHYPNAITKEQALNCKSFKQVAEFNGTNERVGLLMLVFVPDITSYVPLQKPVTWRANGKCKLWKREPNRFRLPIKYGLNQYGYLDETNAHLFEANEVIRSNS